MKFNAIMIALLSMFVFGAEASAADRIIYGDDDRADYYAMPENSRWAADSTVSLWKKNNMFYSQASDSYKLATADFGKAYGLCQGSRFEEQEFGAFCSGALVGEDLVITAGHCIVKDFDCASAAFVFGFTVNSKGGAAPSEIPAGEVYGCGKIIKRQLVDVTTTVDGVSSTVFGPDYALIKLDRPVKNHKPLAINRNGGLKKGDSLFATGHPLGLPFKFTPGGNVVKNVDPQSAYFFTNLDTFGGNSGSPVFNAATGLIEGIHVRGEGQHFIPTFEGCNTYLVRPPGTGSGGQVTKIEFLAEDIPLTPQEMERQTYAGVSTGELQKALEKMEVPSPDGVRFDF